MFISLLPTLDYTERSICYASPDRCSSNLYNCRQPLSLEQWEISDLMSARERDSEEDCGMLEGHYERREEEEDIRASSRHSGGPEVKKGRKKKKEGQGQKKKTGPTRYIHNMARPDAMKVDRGGGGDEPNCMDKE